jgi:hypothetical protein
MVLVRMQKNSMPILLLLNSINRLNTCNANGYICLMKIVSEEFDIKEGENRFKLFDRISDDRMACLKTVNGIISDEIFWIDYMLGGSPASLNIRMNEYLNIGFNNLFFLNWQQAFLKNDQEKKTFINFYRKQLFTP